MRITGILAEKGFHAFDAEPHQTGGHIVPRIWIVVADGVRALIFRKAGKDMERIAEARPGYSAATHADKGGASFHGYDVRSEKYHHGEGAFIHNLAAWLDEAERAKAFDRLVLVAAPRALGDLREALSKEVCLRVSAEKAKDLTELSEGEIRRHLSDIVWF